MTQGMAGAERFYKIWIPLLRFVGRQKGIPMTRSRGLPASQLAAEDAVVLREELWSSPELLDDFVSQDPANLDAVDREVVQGWRHGIGGAFFVYRHRKEYTIFLGEGSPARAYAVRSLATPLSELAPNPPTMVKARLLPFAGRIVFDTFLAGHPVLLGPGIRRALDEDFRRAEEREGIVTSLGPDGPGWELAEADRVRESNAKVLQAFRRDLRRRTAMTDGRADAHVERVAVWAAQDLLARSPPRRLVDATDDDLDRFLQANPEAAPTSFERFAIFLRDTGRVSRELGWSLRDTAKQARSKLPTIRRPEDPAIGG